MPVKTNLDRCIVVVEAAPAVIESLVAVVASFDSSAANAVVSDSNHDGQIHSVPFSTCHLCGVR